MKYIVIDSNIYRSIFSPSENFPEEIKDSLLKLIEKEKIKLLLPLQIKQEVERNRFSEWYENSLTEMTQKISKKESDISDIQKKYERYPSHRALIKSIQKDKKEVEKIVKALGTRFKDKRSKSNQILKEIFLRAEVIPETNEIISSAELRTKKRNPPREGEGYFGDAIIWESLISYFKQRERQSGDSLIFVSNDKTAWGNEGLNLWLEDEWRIETESRITLIYNFSDIPGLTKRDIDKIKHEEAENLKENIISDFVSSHSWYNSGSNAQRLLMIKDKLKKTDLEKVIKASLENHEIYGSFFTPIPLKELVSDGPDFAFALADKIEDSLWKAFCVKFQINLVRKKEIPF